MRKAGHTIDKLIYPITSNEFFNEYWEKKTLYIKREEKNYWKDVLTPKEVDDALCSLNLRLGEVSLTRAAGNVESDKYTIKEKLIDVVKLFQYYHKGYTIIMNHMDLRIRGLAELTSSLAKEFSMPLQTNLYLTPQNSQGFNTHYDTHCVFILQVSGSKKWRIYKRKVEFPTDEYAPEQGEYSDQMPVEEFQLEPGDIAYIPRGIPHDALTVTGEDSLHITLGVLSYNWYDLMGCVLEISQLRNSNFRKALPIGFAFNQPIDEINISYRELVNSLSSEAFLKEAMTMMSEKFIKSRRSIIHGQLADKPTYYDNLILNQYSIFNFVYEEDFIRINVTERTIVFPISFYDQIKFVLSGNEFTIDEIPGNHDLIIRIQIIDKLIDYGLLRKVPQVTHI